MKNHNRISALALGIALAAGTTACTGSNNSNESHPSVASAQPSAELPIAQPSLPLLEKTQAQIDAEKAQLDVKNTAELNARKAAAVANLQPVNMAKLNTIIATVQEEGISPEWSKGTVYRIVREGNDGTVYTPQIEYNTAPGDNLKTTRPDNFTLYIRRPGEENAQHVVIDGVGGLSQDKLSSSIDGVADSPLGYNMPSNPDTYYDSLVDKFGSELAGTAMDVEALTAKGSLAQSDYTHAIETIRP